ncbi:hypothetical protein [Paenibacillus sp. JZ16]|uniref:hypothetical protein n=1 Tax=Paenibacillus sp. JZ16 TaxID=1906272 RepID=UPI00188B5505|nr:hypothetical protein [Paenibacillus sp. JZ16]
MDERMNGPYESLLEQLKLGVWVKQSQTTDEPKTNERRAKDEPKTNERQTKDEPEKNKVEPKARESRKQWQNKGEKKKAKTKVN